MPRKLQYPHRVQVYFGDTEFELLKGTAELLGITPADLIRAALWDNLEKARINTSMWAHELMTEASK